MSEDEVERGIGRASRAEIVFETSDHFDAAGAGGGEVRADAIEHGAREPAAAKFGKHPGHAYEAQAILAGTPQPGGVEGSRVSQRIVGCPDQEAALGIGKVPGGGRVGSGSESERKNKQCPAGGWNKHTTIRL